MGTVLKEKIGKPSTLVVSNIYLETIETFKENSTNENVWQILLSSKLVATANLINTELTDAARKFVFDNRQNQNLVQHLEEIKKDKEKFNKIMTILFDLK